MVGPASAMNDLASVSKDEASRVACGRERAGGSRIVHEIDLDKPGKRSGFLRLYHSTHESAYGFIPIPLVVINGGPGPTVLFVAGNHGDEYEGQLALTRLAQELQPEQLGGRVVILPAANLPAVREGRRVSPIDNGNLNRLFPGDPAGSVTEQIAWFIEDELLTRCDVVCDLHSGGSSLEYVPCVLVRRRSREKLYSRGVELVKSFGAEYVYVSRIAQGGDATLFGASERKGVVHIGSELGGAGRITPLGLAIAQRGVRNLLVTMGMLAKEAWTPVEPPRVLVETRGWDDYSYSPEDGVLEPLTVLGETVEAGQTAARIYFPETPWQRPVEVPFRKSGIVFCQRVPGRVKRGDCLLHLVGTTEF